MRLTWEVSGGDRHLKFYEVRDNLSSIHPHDDGRSAALGSAICRLFHGACRIQSSRVERGLGIAWVGDKPGAKPAGLGGLNGQHGGLAGHRGQLDEEGHERLVMLLGVDELRGQGELDVLGFPEEGGDLVATEVDVEVGGLDAGLGVVGKDLGSLWWQWCGLAADAEVETVVLVRRWSRRRCQSSLVVSRT
jgi:hypothetical protein